MSMLKSAFAAVLLSAFLAIISTARADEPKDAYGDPLPVGAKARLGTARGIYWDGREITLLPPDYKTFAIINEQGTVVLRDVVTGRELKRLNVEMPRSGHLLACSPDGKRLATLHGGLLTVWDVSKGHQLISITKGPEVPFRPEWNRHRLFSFSGDGKLLAIGGLHYDVKLPKTKDEPEPEVPVVIWDVDKNKQLARFAIKGLSIVIPILSRDGKTLLTLSLAPPSGSPLPTKPNEAKPVQVWDVLTGKLTKKIEMSKGEPVALVLSPDAGMAAASHLDGSIELWDVRTGKNVVHLPGQGKIRFPLGLAPGQQLAFSPNGETLAAIGRDGIVQRWAISDGRLITQTLLPINLSAMLSFADNDHIVVWRESDRSLAAWDVPSGKMLAPHHVQGNFVGIGFAAGGKEIVTSGSGPRLIQWETASGKPMGSIGLQLDGPRNPAIEFAPIGAALSLDATRAVWPPGPAGTSSPQLFDAATGAKQFTLPSPAKSCGTECLTTPDMSHLVRVSVPVDPKATTASCEDWDLPNQKKLKEFTFIVVTESGERLLDPINFSNRRLSLSPDGTRLVSISTAQRKPRVPGQAPTLPDLLISGWDLTTGKLLSTTRAPFDLIRGIKAVSNTGAVYVANSGAVRAVDYERGVLGLEIDRIRIGSMPVIMTMSSDGTRLAIGVADKDGLFGVRVYDWPRGKPLHTFTGHSAPISCLAFSPDGKTLASGSHDTTVLLWDISKIGE